MSNLVLGCLALLFIFRGAPEMAAWCTIGSLVCDYFDGLVARALKIASPIGKELDSLSDVVSFGVVPAALLFTLISGHSEQPALPTVAAVQTPLWAYAVFILSAFAALRLAKFNLDTRQSRYFLGLSTPACTLFVWGWAGAAQQNLFGWGEALRQPALILGVTAVLSALLVSEIPMFGMKISGKTRAGWLPVVVAAIAAVPAFYFFKIFGLTILVVLYVVASLLFRKAIVSGA